MFGRGGEEALALATAGVPFRIVPGVTAGLGALAAALIPATMRGINRAIIFAAGHGSDQQDDPDWAALARTGQPIVLYMGLTNLARVCEALVGGGLDPRTAVAVIAAATTDEERIVTSTLQDVVRTVQRQPVGSPAIIVIGKIVEMRGQLLRLLQSAAGS
jgi:uroporphyrin-III C-methyltransferase